MMTLIRPSIEPSIAWRTQGDEQPVSPRSVALDYAQVKLKQQEALHPCQQECWSRTRYHDYDHHHQEITWQDASRECERRSIQYMSRKMHVSDQRDEMAAKSYATAPRSRPHVDVLSLCANHGPSSPTGKQETRRPCIMLSLTSASP